jgi:GTP-binding protein HflX
VAADLVLHVIDASHPQADEQREIGNQVLADLGIDSERVIEVDNKADVFDRPAGNRRCTISALTGEGIDILLDTIRTRERESGQLMRLEIPHDESRLVARLHEVGEIHERIVNDEVTFFSVWVPRDAVHLFQQYSADRLLQAVKG